MPDVKIKKSLFQNERAGVKIWQNKRLVKCKMKWIFH